MSYLFDDAGPQFFTTTTLPATTEPFSVSMWLKTDDDTDEQYPFALGQDGSGIEMWRCEYDGTAAGEPIKATTRTGASSDAVSTTAFSKDIWHHIVCAFGSGANREIWMNGGGHDSDTFNRAVATPDEFTIGARPDGSNSWSGRIAEVAIYSVGFTGATDVAVAQLATGASALLVRPDVLVSYWPFIGNTNDLIAGNILTATASAPTADQDHPQIYYPARPNILAAVEAAAVTFTGELHNPIFRVKPRGYGYLREGA